MWTLIVLAQKPWAGDNSTADVADGRLAGKHTCAILGLNASLQIQIIHFASFYSYILLLSKEGTNNLEQVLVHNY